MKKVILVFAFGAIGLGAKAQINISSSGNVGIGVTAPYCKLQILDGANEYVFSKYGGINFGGHQAGESITRLDFWHPTAGWNKVRFKGYTLSSDSTLKTDILPLEEVIATQKLFNNFIYIIYNFQFAAEW